MSSCILPVPIESEDDRWISIVIPLTFYGFLPLFIQRMMNYNDKLCFSALFSSINASYRTAVTKMPKSYLSVTVCWKRYNILKRGINTLPHCIH